MLKKAALPETSSRTRSRRAAAESSLRRTRTDLSAASLVAASAAALTRAPASAPRKATAARARARFCSAASSLRAVCAARRAWWVAARERRLRQEEGRERREFPGHRNEEKRGNGHLARGAGGERRVVRHGGAKNLVWGSGGGGGAGTRLALFVLLGDGVDAFDELLSLAGALFESRGAERLGLLGLGGDGGRRYRVSGGQREARGKKRQGARSGRETRLEASVDGRAVVLHDLGLHERGGVVHVRDPGVVRGGDGGLSRQRRRREELLASGFLRGVRDGMSATVNARRAPEVRGHRARATRERGRAPLSRARDTSYSQDSPEIRSFAGARGAGRRGARRAFPSRIAPRARSRRGPGIGAPAAARRREAPRRGS